MQKKVILFPFLLDFFWKILYNIFINNNFNITDMMEKK